jgi:ribosome maturation factor RimP
MNKTVTTLRECVASVVNPMGYEFVGLELQRQGRTSLLRIYIDAEKGVTVDDCARVSRQVSAVLDVEDPIQGKYDLEVSSPGIDRPLFELAHYTNQLGKRIKIRVNKPVDERRNFVGFLLRVEGNEIHLLVNGEEMIFPFATIDKAKLVTDNAGDK